MFKCNKHEECCCNAVAAFSYLGLAVAVGFDVRTKEPGVLPELSSVQYRYEDVPVGHRVKLREAMRVGQVTTIVQSPEPLQYFICKTTAGEARCVYGVWLERRASWYGKKTIPSSAFQDASKLDFEPPEDDPEGGITDDESED